MTQPTNQQLLEAIQGVEQRIEGRIDTLDRKLDARFDDLQDQIVNLATAFVRAGIEVDHVDVAGESDETKSLGMKG